MQINPEELFAQIGHLTVENKMLYGHIAELQQKLAELSNDEDEVQDETPDSLSRLDQEQDDASESTSLDKE